MIYLILSLVIAGIGTGSFLWIKSLYGKNKSLKHELDVMIKMNIQIKENVIHYKEIIVKLNKKDAYVEDLNNQIDNATGDDLTRLANSL